MQTNRCSSVCKMYYRIGEVAEILGVEPSVLRHWESEFPSVRPERSNSGQRIYSQRDVERLRLIKQLHYEDGLTLKGVRKVLRNRGIEIRDTSDPVVIDNRNMRQTLVSVRQMLVQALDDLQ